MTYVNGNVYEGPTSSAPLDRYAHDSCLPAAEYELVVINGRDTGERHQRWPWHWHPSPTGFTDPCHFCRRPVT
jgi:hypothetical protein